ncbi:hypothetical protein ACMFMF_009454 [Clarireedia jacksonii]
MAAYLVDSCGDNSFGPQVKNRDAHCRGGFDFTLFFEETIFSIGPSSLLLLVIPCRIACLYGKRVKVLPNSLFVWKLVTISIYACIQLALLTLWASLPAPRTSATTPSAALNLAAALFLILLSHLEHQRSIRPSSIINIYIFSSLLLDIARVRTQWLLSHHEPSIAALLAVSVALKCVILALEATQKRRLLVAAYRNRSIESTEGIFSRFFFWWLNPLFLAGSRKVLRFEDLFQIDEALDSEAIACLLQNSWDKYCNSTDEALFYALFRTFKWPFLSIVIPRLCVVALSVSQPFLVQEAINFVTKPNSQQNTDIGYGLIGGYGLIYIGIAVMTAWYQHRIYRSITMIRGGLISMIYQKMTEQAIGGITESSAITLMATDVEQIATGLQTSIDFAANFIQMGIALWLLERQLGVACVAPVFTGLSFSFSTLYMGKVLVKSQKAWFEAVQRRVNITSEALESMKGIKFSGLTDRLTELLRSLRNREVDISRKYRIFRVYSVVLANLPSQINPALCFTIYALVQQARGSDTINIEKAFTSLSLLALLTYPIYSIISATSALQSTAGCIYRIQEYLRRDSRQDYRLDYSSDSGLFESSKLNNIALSTFQSPQTSFQKDTIVIQDGSFGWSQTESPILSDININFRQQLTLIVGPSGGGKSTLLKAILGETHSFKGFIYTSSPEIAFCDQVTWIQNKSLRDNIIGDTTFDEVWYSQVVKASALETDFAHLATADLTVVGSNGIGLSGGQKQRLAIARAVYARKPIAIFDDVFSGLDERTAQHVFENIFGPEGLLRNGNTTVILVTHAVHRTPAADHIVVLQDGRITQQGTYTQLNSIPGYVRSLNIEDRIHDQEEDKSSASELYQVNESRNMKDISTAKFSTNHEANNGSENNRKDGDFSIYKYYINSVGWMNFLLFGIYITVSVVFSTIMPFFWLNWWSDASSQNSSAHGLGYWLGIFMMFAALAAGSTFMVVYHFNLRMVTTSAKNLHEDILRAVMRAPLMFFTTTDTGTTLNRFSQDMQLVDLTLPSALINASAQAANVIAQAILVCIATKYISVMIPLLCLILYFVQKFYLRTSRQLRIMDIEAKAPLYSHFIESINGLATIRAFGRSKVAMKVHTELLDNSQKPYYLLLCIQRWLTLVLDLVVAGIAIVLMGSSVSLKDHVSPGLLGIAMVNVMEFGTTLSMLISMWTLLETSLGGIARIRSFATDTTCEDLPGEVRVPPPEWPERGEVVFEGISASYGTKDNSALVLDNMSCTIPAGSKFGIIGRSGSGKSSLLLTLFRMLDLRAGSITIDGLDISTIPRQEIRSRLTILPQDPFFLSGTVRLNVDPFEIRSDQEIREAFVKVGVWETIEQNGGLDAKIGDSEEGPSLHLSEGQKQLFCLAGAILRKSTVLVLDEATSR